jgi:hypothetical protein
MVVLSFRFGLEQGGDASSRRPPEVGDLPRLHVEESGDSDIVERQLIPERVEYGAADADCRCQIVHRRQAEKQQEAGGGRAAGRAQGGLQS